MPTGVTVTITLECDASDLETSLQWIGERLIQMFDLGDAKENEKLDDSPVQGTWHNFLTRFGLKVRYFNALTRVAPTELLTDQGYWQYLLRIANGVKVVRGLGEKGLIELHEVIHQHLQDSET